MEAYYYCIFEDATGVAIDEGIIRDIEDTICPQQNTGIEELPFECPCHHFEAKGYTMKGFAIDIPVGDIYKYKVGF